jgi:ABC-type sugar transport system permease subunit
MPGMSPTVRVALAWLVVLVIVCIGLAGFVLALLLTISRDGPERYLAALMLPFCFALAKIAAVAKDKIDGSDKRPRR